MDAFTHLVHGCCTCTTQSYVSGKSDLELNGMVKPSNATHTHADAHTERNANHNKIYVVSRNLKIFVIYARMRKI